MTKNTKKFSSGLLDCLVVKCKEDNRVINKAVYMALAINMDGLKEILGFWISNNEGAKFCLSIVTNTLREIIKNKQLFTDKIIYFLTNQLQFKEWSKRYCY